MSADKINVHSCGGYNFYTVKKNGIKWVIGGVPEQYKATYIDEAFDADRIVLLTSKPEFTGGLSEVLEHNPDALIYASSAGLRNIKEIVNREIAEKLIKDNMTEDGMEFFIAPNLPWVDTVLVKVGDTLFTGEIFSNNPTLEAYYESNLRVNREFVISAVERVAGFGVCHIYPSRGDRVDCGAIEKYRSITAKSNCHSLATVIYSSTYGYTKSMADIVAEGLKQRYTVKLYDVKTADLGEVIEDINNSSALAVGTNTINRNAPKEIWDAITGIDLVNNRQMPYFVFGSFGWAGDGIKLIDKTLSAMGMRQVIKPCEVLFKPTDEDFARLKKAIVRLNEYKKDEE